MDVEDEKLDLCFEEGDLSLGEILSTFPLPVVVQCDTASCPIPVDRSRFNFDLTQPLLLYRKRTIQKVTARNLHIDPQSRRFQEVGDSLLIPEDYKGKCQCSFFFRIVSSSRFTAEFVYITH